MKESTDIKIFVACHKPTILPKCDLFVPIQLGKALTDLNLDMLHDNTGDNISEKNKSYCELTAQYWAWKNIDADYYGLCHYRRFFSFSDKPIKIDVWGAHEYDVLSAGLQRELGMDSDTIRQRLSEADLIVGTSQDIEKQKMKNLYDQYGSAPELRLEDLKLAIQILKEKYPDYSDAADNYMDGKVFYPCNMFIMKKQLFFEYSSWLFDILNALEPRIDMTYYSVEGRRTLGHIAERLLGIYVTKKQTEGITTKVLPRIIVRNTDPMSIPSPAFSNNNIPIVFSCNDYFVPYAAVTVQSLLEHTNEKNNYDIIILHTNVSADNQQHLKKLTHNAKNVSMRFVNIIELTNDMLWVANNHITVESFYRLFIPHLFNQYEKLLYLDCDLIILRDVADLYNINMEHHILAATVDADHAGQYGSNNNNVVEYSDHVLCLEKPYEYFQAGVLLFNIKEFNHTMDLNNLIAYAQEREYMYMDQDILNAKLKGRIQFITLKWNVMTNTYNFRMNGLIRRSAPESIWNEYYDARQDPYIIHYAGGDKPWINPETDLAFIFWSYARRNPFYEIILNRMIHKKSKEDIKREITKIRRRVETVDHVLNKKVNHTLSRMIFNKLVPEKSRRREIIRKMMKG